MSINFSKTIMLCLGLFISAMPLYSCVTEAELSTAEPTRYTTNTIKSYTDLFNVFWKVMDERDHYFYKQKRSDGMEWDAVYREYYPKFEALKTFDVGNDKDIIENRAKAEQYFTDIIDPILNHHFYVLVKLPYSKGVTGGHLFRGGMKNKPNNQYSLKSGQTIRPAL